MTESQILRDIRLELGRQPDVVLWRNETGVAQHDEGRVRYGLCPGSADLIGVGPGGRFLAIEVKAPGARTQKDRIAKQKAFLRLVRSYGGISGMAESVYDALRIVQEAR